MKPMLASPAGPVIPFPMLLSPKLDGIAKAVYRGSKGGMMNKHTKGRLKMRQGFDDGECQGGLVCWCGVYGTDGEFASTDFWRQ